MDDFVGSREDLDPTIIPYKNNNAIVLKRHAPYGFWSMSLQKGPLPNALSGLFTSRNLALDHLNRFLKSPVIDA